MQDISLSTLPLLIPLPLSRLRSEKVLYILAFITARLFSFFTSVKSDSLSFSNLSGLSPGGMSGMWLASPLFGLLTFFARSPSSGALDLSEFASISEHPGPSAEFGFYPFLLPTQP